jgi:hypothetical protein
MRPGVWIAVRTIMAMFVMIVCSYIVVTVDSMLTAFVAIFIAGTTLTSYAVTVLPMIRQKSGEARLANMCGCEDERQIYLHFNDLALQPVIADLESLDDYGTEGSGVKLYTVNDSGLSVIIAKGDLTSGSEHFIKKLYAGSRRRLSTIVVKGPIGSFREYGSDASGKFFVRLCTSEGYAVLALMPGSMCSIASQEMSRALKVAQLLGYLAG